MIVYRLAKSKYSRDLSGKGCEKTGGRWNSKGIPMVYTSESRALCTAEIAVHIQLSIIPSDFVLITINIPNRIKIYELETDLLPKDWNSIPHSMTTQKLGDKLIVENKYAVLKVPSVVVPGDFNYLINPFHEQVKLLKILKVEIFSFDYRLFVK